jgi:putative photosynthetic complex assembly protein 2
VEVALPIAFAIALWWASTVLVMYLDGLRTSTFRFSLIGGATVAAFALWGLAASAAATSVAAVYQGFVCALAVWGFVELTFLTGFITGPRKTPCPPSRGWQRFRYACEAIAYHELALLGALGLVALVSSNGPNRIGLATLLALWLMRLSSKLNLYLGVPNLGEQLLPDGLKYLRTYFRRRALNVLFPLAVTAMTVVAALLIYAAMGPAVPAPERTTLVLLAALVALGALEHWLLVLPLPAELLWRPALASRLVVPGAQRTAGGVENGTAASSSS